jgi:hypothetical protein
MKYDWKSFTNSRDTSREIGSIVFSRIMKVKKEMKAKFPAVWEKLRNNGN